MTKRKRVRIDYSKIHGDKIKKRFEDKGFQQNPKLLTFDSKVEKHTLILRFLPDANEDEVPFFAIKSHNIYRGKGNYHFSTCMKTIGAECPICEVNSSLDNNSIVKEERLYPSTKYMANVLVVKDSQNPENENTVMVLEYPKTVQLFLLELLKGDEELDLDPCYYYDLDNGVDIVIKKTGQKIKTEYKISAKKTSAVDKDFDDMIDKEIEALEEFALKIHPLSKDKDKMKSDYVKFLQKNDLME